MRSHIFARRQFLRGTGGITLGLPFLPSLLPRDAAAALPGGPPRLVLMCRSHGGIHVNNDVAASALPNRTEIHPGHTIAWGPIPRTVQNGKTAVTRILQADSSILTDGLLAKMNVLRGLDNPNSAPAHGDKRPFGGLGPSIYDAYAGKDRGFVTPSIDQFLAWSPSYNAPGSYVLRSIVGGDNGFSVRFKNPAIKVSAPRSGIDAIKDLTTVSADSDPGRLFDKLFAPAATPPPPSTPTAMPRKPLVDHVLANYRLIQQSNRRLSVEDRRRLDEHMTMMRELQRRVSSAGTIKAGAGCSKPARTDKPPLDSPAKYIALYQTYNDLIAAAFKCGLTRVATLAPELYAKDYFREPTADWHNLCHGAYTGPERAGIVATSNQIFFERVVLDLARKLDFEEAGGRTYLDNSLLVHTNDQGAITHSVVDVFTVTFGDAGGFFKTGLYVDYRNRNLFVKDGGSSPSVGWNTFNPGITIQQFWANVLDALGVPRDEWASFSASGGWGPQDLYPSTESMVLKASHYVPGVRERAGDKLPVVATG